MNRCGQATIVLMLLGAIVGRAATALASGNLVKNGSFEEVGPEGAPAVWHSDTTSDMVSVGRSTTVAPDGAACFDLGVLEQPRLGQQSLVWQDLALVKAERYLLSFAYRTGYEGRYSGYEDMFVLINGQVIWSCDLSRWVSGQTVAATGFRQAALSFLAPSPSVRLAFGKRGLKSAGRGWRFHSLVDAVSVRQAGLQDKGIEVSAEKPHHVPKPPQHLIVDIDTFSTTMAHLSDSALLDAIDLERPELVPVLQARGRSDEAALAAFCAHLARRQQSIDTVSSERYREELDAYRAAYPAKTDHLARHFNGIYEWTMRDADRTVAGEHLYAGSKSTWVKFEGGHVDWVTSHGNIYGFHYFGSLQPLFLAWLATGGESYADAYARAFRDWWEQRDQVQPQWCVWYKLGLAIRGRRLARALHHMAGTGSFDVQTETHILKTILGSCRWLTRDWEFSPAWSSNWGLFVATGLIRMGVLFPEFRESDGWIELGETIMKRYASAFKADGGTEALGYHRGILLSLLQPHELLAANGRPGYLDEPKLREGIARGLRILARMLMPDGRYPAIGDAFYGEPAEALALGCTLLQDTEVKGLLTALSSKAVADEGAFCIPGFPPFRTQAALDNRLLPGVAATPWAPRSYVFPDHGLTAFRHGTSPEDTVYLAVSHGVYGHSHLDFLGITLFAHGSLLLGDRGVPSYYGPHAGEMRRSRAHSTLIVDGANMKPIEPKLELFETSDAADLWQCRSAAYEHLGVLSTRTIVHVRRDPACFAIIDRVRRTTDVERTLDVYFHAFTDAVHVSPQCVTIGEGPVVTLVTSPGNGELRQGSEWSILHETSMVTKQLPFIAFRKVSGGDESFCTVLACDPAESRAIRVTSTLGESGTFEVAITERDTRHLVLVAADAGTLPVSTQGPAGLRLLAGEGGPVQLYRSERSSTK